MPATDPSLTATTTTYEVPVAGIGAVPVTVTSRGEGRPFLVLHGGAGPQSVDGFSELLARSDQARVLTPLHPGFGGTPAPPRLRPPPAPGSPHHHRRAGPAVREPARPAGPDRRHRGRQLDRRLD